MLDSFKEFFDNFDIQIVKSSKGNVNFPAMELRKKQPAFYALIDSIYMKVFSEKSDNEILFYYVYLVLKFFEKNFPEFDSDKKVDFNLMLKTVMEVENSKNFHIEDDFLFDIFNFLNKKLVEDIEDEGLSDYKDLFSFALFSIFKVICKNLFEGKNSIH